MWDGEVLHYVTKAQQLTQGHFILQDDWHEWNSSEYTQLNQYEAQGMFGSPTMVSSEDAEFNLVWTMQLRRSTTVRKLNAHVMAHPAQDRSGSSTSCMQTVLTKQAPEFSMWFQQQRTYLSSVQMSRIPLQSPPHQNKASRLGWTKRSMTGG